MVRWIVLAAALLLIGLGAFWPDDSPSIAWQSPAGLVVLEPAGAVLLEDEVGEALVEQWIAAGILSRGAVEKAKRYIRDRRDGEGVTSVTSVTSGEGEGG